MNPLAFLFAPFAASGAAFDAACPACGTPVRFGVPCASCGVLTVDGRPVKPGFRQQRYEQRLYAPPPDEVVADLKAQLDAFTAGLERISRASPGARSGRANDDRAYEKKRARQRAGAKRAKEARKKQRGR